jgi:hypothetical protein
MPRNEIETVLANWIGQALSPLGQLPQGTDAAEWIARRFAEWRRERAGRLWAMRRWRHQR